jgi:prevent-host-death family protein
MKRTSITDAKNGLSALIDRVRHGESIIIEDRGVPVARLEPVAVHGRRDVEGRAARLQRQGIVRPPVSAPPKRLVASRPPAPSGAASLSDVLLAERRDHR